MRRRAAGERLSKWLRWLPFAALAGATGVLARISTDARQREREEPAPAAEPVEPDPAREADAALDLDELELEIGYGLIPHVTADRGGELPARIRGLRKQLARELGDNQGIGRALNNLGLVAFERGDLLAARALHEESLTVKRELGDKRGIAHSLANLGSVALAEDELAVAQRLFRECLARFRQLGFGPGIAWTLESLANRLGLPGEPLRQLLELLRKEGFLEQTGDDPPGYLPATDIESIEVRELLAAVRKADESRFLCAEHLSGLDPVDGAVDRIDEAVSEALSDITLKDLVLQGTRKGPTGLARGERKQR